MIYPLLTLTEIRKQYDGLKVRVFISNDGGRWAVEDYKTQKRIFNANYLTLKDVSTYIDQAKRKQCVKHVRLTHAYVVGTIGDINLDLNYQRIDYHPHEQDCFFWVKSGIKFTEAQYAICDQKHVWAVGLTG